MPAVKLNGIVLRAVDYSDFDRILTLFTLERGRVAVRARGIRRANSKLKIAGTIFASGEFVLYEHSSRFTVNEANITENHYNLRYRLQAFSHASFIASVLASSIQDDEPQPLLFALFSRALAYYCYGELDAVLVTQFTLTKLMELLGFKPELHSCTRCSKSHSLSFFSPACGGVLCSDCADSERGNVFSLDPVLLDFLKGFETVKFKTLPAAEPLGGADSAQLTNLLVAFTEYQLGRHFRAVELLNSFQPD